MNEKKVVVVTGAAGNLGRSVVREFSSQEFDLALIDLNIEKLESAFRFGDEKKVYFPADLNNHEEVALTVESIISEFGKIDILCNLAGGFFCGSPVHETKPQVMDLMFELNVRTLYNVACSVIPHMITQRYGRVINIGSFGAQRGMAGLGAYTAAKSAVERLTESMSSELRQHNINVNCVLPTILDTLENRSSIPAADYNKWLKPTDLARIIAFLASDDAHVLNGVTLPVVGPGG